MGNKFTLVEKDLCGVHFQIHTNLRFRKHFLSLDSSSKALNVALQMLDSLRVAGINPFLDNRIGRTRRLLKPGNVVVSLCRNRDQLFFTPKFAWLAGFLPFPCGLLCHLLVRKQVDAFKSSLEWSPRDPKLSQLPLSLCAQVVFDTQILLCS